MLGLFQSFMMGILNDEVMQMDSDGTKLCVCYTNSFIQWLSNPSPSDIKFTEEIVSTSTLWAKCYINIVASIQERYILTLGYIFPTDIPVVPGA